MKATDAQLRKLAKAGKSDPAIAAELGISPRTVLRWRHRLGIGSEWLPPKPPHGTTTRYGAPHRCRCRSCREANTEAMRAWRAAQQRVTVPHARKASEPWLPAEDQLLLASELSTAALARELGRSYDATRKRRDRLRARQAGGTDPALDEWFDDLSRRNAALTTQMDAGGAA